jgi:SAM-dependent methyltransferase
MPFQEVLRGALERMISKCFEDSRRYWDLVAETYDQIFPETLIGQTHRCAVWKQLEELFQPGERILEMNCGTGIDAVHLAQRGVRVLACDISPRMIELASQRSVSAHTSDLTDFRVLPTEQIGQVAADGPFDGALSDFSGLNCVEDLVSVARNLGHVLRPGASALICMAGCVAPWEIVWHLCHGQPKKAMRRIRPATEDPSVHVRFPTVGAITRAFVPAFRLQRWCGIGIAVPPSCMEPLARRHPGLLKVLARADEYLAPCPLIRLFADCVLLRFERLST